VAGLAAVLAIWRQPRLHSFSWDTWRDEFLLLWIFVPLLLTLAVSLVKPLFVPRYFIFCLPALLLLLARGITRLHSWLAVPAISLLLILSLGGTSGYYRQDLDIDRNNWRAITQSLLSSAHPGDALMFHVPMGRMPYDFYRSLQPWQTGPVVLYPRHADRITFLDFVEKPNDSEIARSLPSYPRVWLVLTYATTPSGMPDARTIELTQLLAPLYSMTEERDFSGVKLLLYSRKNR
jgi:hypothetical protein